MEKQKKNDEDDDDEEQQEETAAVKEMNVEEVGKKCIYCREK